MKKIKRLSVLAALIAGSSPLHQPSLASVQQPLFANNLPADIQNSSTINNSASASPGEEVLENSKTVDSTPPNNYILSLAEKLLNNLVAQTQEKPKPEDKAKFDRLMQYAAGENLYKSSFPQIMQEIARQFIGTSYQSNLLETSNIEKLVVTLNKLDCVLFVETVLAIARGVSVQNYSYDTFADRLSDQRYRDGRIDGYCSRLHYFNEWIADNEKRGTIRDMARELGGVTLHKKLDFMSQHKRMYPQLVSSDANYQCMVAMENRISEIDINYIPLSKIRSVYEKLQPGDIVAIATSIDGLDVTHTGLVYRTKNGNIGFIHASPAGAVKIAPDLQTYASRINRSIGIMLARPVDPRQMTQNNQLPSTVLHP